MASGKSVVKLNVITLPTSSAFNRSVAPVEVPALILYPVTVAMAFQLRSVVTKTSVALFNGLDKVVQLGRVAKVSVVNDSSPQLMASPTELYGVIVTYIVVASGKVCC